MTTQFQCENCETIIEIANPVIGSTVECPICFTMHIVRDVKLPKLEAMGANKDDGGNTQPIQLPTEQTVIPSLEGKYLCIPFRGITRSHDQYPGKTLSDQLEKILNERNSQGWQFLRIDTVRVFVQPGCLAGLLGARVQQLEYDIVIFKRS